MSRSLTGDMSGTTQTPIILEFDWERRAFTSCSPSEDKCHAVEVGIRGRSLTAVNGNLSSAQKTTLRTKTSIQCNPSRDASRKFNLINYGVAIGVPLFLLGMSAPVIIGVHFWWNVSFFYIGIIWFIYGVNYNALMNWPVAGRFSALFACILFIMLVSGFCIFTTAPMRLFVDLKVPTYGEGSVYAGIAWEPDYSQLDFSISNLGSIDYRNVVAKVSTDLVFYALQQFPGTECKSSMENPTIPPTVQTMVGNKPVGPVGVGSTTNEPKEFYAVVPLYKNGTVGPPLGADTTYIITCDRIPAQTQMHFVGALRVINKYPAKFLGGPPRPVKWLTMEVTFDADGRPRHLVFSKCANHATCVLAPRLD